MNRDNIWLAGCFMAASGIGLGAFGAHGLRKMNMDMSKVKSWETAAHYQLIHSLGVLISLQSQSLWNKPRLPENLLPAKLLLAGTLLFSGSIYCLVLNANRFKWLGPVTPIGGLLMMSGWVALGWSTVR